MATKIGALFVEMRLRSAKIEQGLKRVGDRITRFGSTSKRAAANVGKLTAGLSAAAGLGGAGLIAASRQAARLADEIGKSADAVGLTTDAYQELVFVADKAGISQSQFNSNLLAFVKRVGEARKGLSPLNSFLRKYDQELLQAIQNTTNQEQAFNLIAQAIDEAGSATERAAIANAAFSRAGVRMVNILRDGTEGMNALRREAQDVGVVIEERLIRQAEAANDRLSVLSQVISTRVSVALLELQPQLEAIADTLIETLPAIVSFTKNMIGAQTETEKLQEEITTLAAERDRLLDLRGGRQGAVYGFYSRILGLETADELLPQINEINEMILQKQKELQEKLAAQVRTAEAEPEQRQIPALITAPEPAQIEAAAEARATELERYRESLAEKLLILEESLMTELEREQAHWDQRQLLIDNAFADGIIPTEERYYELSEQLAEKHQAELSRIEAAGQTERQRFEALSLRQKTQFVLGQLQTLTQGVAQENKALFRINQAAAAANAIINTYQGVSKTLGTYPWPIAQVLAAAHLAAGLGQVAAIRGASFQGGAAAPSLAGGGAVTAPVATFPTEEAPGALAQQEPVRVVNISLQGAGYSKQDVRVLIEQINEEVGDGVDLAVA